MIKLSLLVLGLILGVIGGITWTVRQAAAKKRIQEFDDGTRCIVCHKTNMERAGTQAKCLDCLHVSDLSALQAAVVTDDQIAAATARRDHADRD